VHWKGRSTKPLERNNAIREGKAEGEVFYIETETGEKEAKGTSWRG